MSGEAEVTALVRRLADLGLEDLRAEWRRRYGAPPKLRSLELLRHLLAWKLQTDALGGLDDAARLALKRKGAGRRGVALAFGTKLAREWKGVRHEAVITDDGVEYAGQRYASLSEVARTITGSRWSGPRFFGLREGA